MPWLCLQGGWVPSFSPCWYLALSSVPSSGEFLLYAYTFVMRSPLESAGHSEVD